MKTKADQKRGAGLSDAHAREAFGKIKINLEFLSVDNRYTCILLSSSVAAEGKSTVSANLAISLAASEHRVLLVDADLRHPTQHRLFDLANKVGLSDIIANGLDWRLIINDTGTRGLSVITGGRMPPNPSELLGSNRMGELVEEFRKEFDIILFDSSPILLVPDSISLSKHVDGIVVVARQNFTTTESLVSVRESLRLAGKPVIGTILNNVTRSNQRYEYRYDQGDDRKHRKQSHEQPAKGRLRGKLGNTHQ